MDFEITLHIYKPEEMDMTWKKLQERNSHERTQWNQHEKRKHTRNEKDGVWKNNMKLAWKNKTHEKERRWCMGVVEPGRKRVRRSGDGNESIGWGTESKR
jgi:hypothetical protein